MTHDVTECHSQSVVAVDIISTNPIIIMYNNPSNRHPGLVQRTVSKTYVDLNTQRGDQTQYNEGLTLRKNASRPQNDSSDEEIPDPGPPTFEEKKAARRRNRDPICNETNGYVLMAFIVLLVVFFAFRVNRHELHELRETHGHDSKKPNKAFWWHDALVYQIYPRSFQDSNGDGVGDLRGKCGQ